jgi:hypothetical protein
MPRQPNVSLIDGIRFGRCAEGAKTPTTCSALHLHKLLHGHQVVVEMFHDPN